MPEALPVDHPNLQRAAARHQRTSWIWAGLLAGMGVLTLLVAGQQHPSDPIPWFLAAGLVATLNQPAALALAASLWALPLIALVPGADAAFGPDPIRILMAGGSLDFVGVLLVRLGSAITAWNQFQFYRLLYGTENSAGIDADLPPIPEVIPNQTRALALAGGGCVVVSIGSGLGALAPSLAPAAPELVRVAFWFAIMAIGLGLGVTFSRTASRSTALADIGLGLAGLLLALASGRALPV